MEKNNLPARKKPDAKLVKLFQDIIEDKVFGRRSQVMPEQVTLYGEKDAAISCANLAIELAKEYHSVSAPTASTPSNEEAQQAAEPVEQTVQQSVEEDSALGRPFGCYVMYGGGRVCEFYRGKMPKDFTKNGDWDENDVIIPLYK